MILDLRGITTKEQFHDAVKEQLHLPEYYGRNLDALHDCIMELPSQKMPELIGEEEFRSNLDSFADVALSILKRTC